MIYKNYIEKHPQSLKMTVIAVNIWLVIKFYTDIFLKPID